MQLIRTLVVVVCLAAVAFGLFILATSVYGVGHFQQVVILDSAKPVASVSYYNCPVEEEWRRRELEGNPNLHLSEKASLEGDRFTAWIMFTSGPTIFHEDQYVRQLVVLVEFADGTRACRVVDVPKGKGKEAVVVRLP